MVDKKQTAEQQQAAEEEAAKQAAVAEEEAAKQAAIAEEARLAEEDAAKQRAAEEADKPRDPNALLSPEHEAEQVRLAEEISGKQARIAEQVAAQNMPPLLPAPDRPADQLDTLPGHKRVRIVANCDYSRASDHSIIQLRVNGTNCGLPGYYDLTEEDAEHWFVAAHTDTPPPPLEPQLGTPAAAVVEQKKQARRKLIEDVLDQEERDAMQEKRAKRQERLEAALGTNFTRSP